MDETVLVLTGIGVPPYSARGLTQSLTPIDQADDFRRAISGILLDFSSADFKKFKSTISGNDQQPPAVGGVWPGKTVTVDCITELAYKTIGGLPSRDVEATRTEGDFTFYRPRLLMMVTGFAATLDEWGDSVTWTLELEEV